MTHAGDPAKARQVELILEQVASLPTLSPVAARLLQLTSTDDSDLAEVAKVIESDPALSAKILGLCRRASMGMARQINTVRRAVSMLGLDSVRSAVVSVSVYELMRRVQSEQAQKLDEKRASKAGTDTGATFDRAGYWKHSIAVACTAELLAQELAGSKVAPEEAFLAGMIHGIGKLALDFVLPRAYERVIALAERRQADSSALERSVLGLDSHAAGKRLAEHWGLPYPVQEVIWFHSQPIEILGDSPNRQLVGLVSLAKAIARMMHLGWSGDFGPPPPIDTLCAQLGIDPSVAGTVAEPLQKSLAERCQLLGLDADSGPAVLVEAVSAANRQITRLTSTLADRSKLVQAQGRVLQTIRAFQSTARPGKSLIETLSDVVLSAASLLGPGFYAVLYQHASGISGAPSEEPWQLYQFPASITNRAGATQGHLLHPTLIEPPAGRPAFAKSLATLAETAPDGMLASMVPFLQPHFRNTASFDGLRLVPLKTAAPGVPGPAAILIHDRDTGAALAGDNQIAAITATWAAAIHGSAQHEELLRVNQRLAEVGRSLNEAEKKLAETEALARLGEMTAGAAHEMNNPLTIISGRSQLLAGRLHDLADRAAAEAIVEAADDLTDLITSLNLLAEPPPAHPEPIEIAQILADAVTLASSRVKSTPRIKPTITTGLPEVYLDRELVARALSELLVNAIEAAPDATVELRVSADPLDDRLLFSVLDHGPGLSKRAQHHAFDPFFSEKPAGRQRGLGLPRARGLVSSCGGSVVLGPAPDRGTLATIELRRWRVPSQSPINGDGRVAA